MLTKEQIARVRGGSLANLQEVCHMAEKYLQAQEQENQTCDCEIYQTCVVCRSKDQRPEAAKDVALTKISSDEKGEIDRAPSQSSGHPTQQMKVGSKYKWKHSPQNQLIYLGKRGLWHQFKKIDDPREVWCEVVDDELDMIEEITQQPTDAERLANMLEDDLLMCIEAGADHVAMSIADARSIVASLRAKDKS